MSTAGVGGRWHHRRVTTDRDTVQTEDDLVDDWSTDDLTAAIRNGRDGQVLRVLAARLARAAHTGDPDALTTLHDLGCALESLHEVVDTLVRAHCAAHLDEPEARQELASTLNHLHQARRGVDDIAHGWI